MHEEIRNIHGLLETERFGEADIAIARVLALYPDNPDLLCLQGELYVKLGKMEKAEHIFATVLHHSPNHILGLNNLACVKIYQKKWVEAVSLLKRTLELDPFCEDALENLKFLKELQQGNVTSSVATYIRPQDDCKTSVVFLHIPKTGGTTLTKLIKQIYNKSFIWHHSEGDFRTLPPEEREHYRIIVGHTNLDMNLHRYLPQPCAYVTLLRDPIERILSLYYYISESPWHALHEFIRSKSLKDCVESVGGFANEQTRALSSNASLSDFRGYKRELVENAKENILEKLTVVGITEEYDRFIDQLNKTFGWDIQCYTKKAVTKSRPRRNEIPNETVSAIKKYNQMDIELYNYVKNHVTITTAS